MDDALIKMKYSGAKTKKGVMGARASGEALLGFDEMIRSALYHRVPQLRKFDFEIPVKVQEGSWESYIPTAIGSITLTAYLTSIATKAAKDGLFETGIAKDSAKLFNWAGRAIVWFIKITKHIRSFDSENCKTKMLSGTEMEIVNKEGEPLIVPVEYYEFFVDAPPTLLERNASIIDHERVFEFETYDEEHVCIDENEKTIYMRNNDECDQNIVLPELKHGDEVALEGKITRTNEDKRNIGFKYKDHVLEAIPEDRNLEKYKSQIVAEGSDHIFSEKVKIYGIVERKDREDNYKLCRPRIIFNRIRAVKDKQTNLFKE